MMLQHLPLCGLRAVGAAWFPRGLAWGQQAWRQASATALTPEERRAIVEKLQAIQHAVSTPTGSNAPAGQASPVTPSAPALVHPARYLLRQVKLAAAKQNIDAVMGALSVLSTSHNAPPSAQPHPQQAAAPPPPAGSHPSLAAPAANAAVKAMLAAGAKPQYAQAFLELAIQSGALPVEGSLPAAASLIAGYARSSDVNAVLGGIVRLRDQTKMHPSPQALYHMLTALEAHGDSKALMGAWSNVVWPALQQHLQQARRRRALSAAFVSQLAFTSVRCDLAALSQPPLHPTATAEATTATQAPHPASFSLGDIVLGKKAECWKLILNDLLTLRIPLPQPLLLPDHAVQLMATCGSARQLEALLHSPAANYESSISKISNSKRGEGIRPLRLHPVAAAAAVQAYLRIEAAYSGGGNQPAAPPDDLMRTAAADRMHSQPSSGFGTSGLDVPDAVVKALEAYRAGCQQRHQGSLQPLAVAQRALMQWLGERGMWAAALNFLDEPLNRAALNGSTDKQRQKAGGALPADGQALAAVFRALSETGEPPVQELYE